MKPRPILLRRCCGFFLCFEAQDDLLLGISFAFFMVLIVNPAESYMRRDQIRHLENYVLQ